jgi:hypothetical protein
MSKGDIVIQYCGDLVTEAEAKERDLQYKEQQLPPATSALIRASPSSISRNAGKNRFVCEHTV